MWSIGCIFAELHRRRPLFAGDSEIDQIFKIFKMLGTPGSSNWPEGQDLKEYKSTFPKWKPKSLSEKVKLDPFAMDLLEHMVALDPKKRLTARVALRHPYFEGVNPCNL